MNGGRFDFDDGGTYCGGWEDCKAHGHGVCTGPKGQGEYSGAWHYGFEVSGIYTWPSGNTYEGQWQNGKRHGLGVERRGRWVYRGEWSQGFKGRYGVRQSTGSAAKYEGTWANGLQDGYGTETYADGGVYQGQWLRGMRHGYGIRKSVPYSVAAKYRSRSQAHASLTSLRSDQGDDLKDAVDKDKPRLDETSRGGFVLRAKSEPPSRKRSVSERSVAMRRTLLQGFRIKKQRSTGDIDHRVKSSNTTTPTPGPGSLRSTDSVDSEESARTAHENTLPPEDACDPNATETYLGEWKNDQRSGFGVSDRSDGLKYEGEWYSNKKYGYGVTTLKDGTKEEGKYKNNVLLTSPRKKNVLFVRSSKLRERIDQAVSAATRAAQIAIQKADIAASRTATARDRSEQSVIMAMQSQEDSDIARLHAKQYAPDFHQPGTDTLRKRQREHMENNVNYLPHHGRHAMVASTSEMNALTEAPSYGPPHIRSKSLFLSHSKPSPSSSTMMTQQAGPHAAVKPSSSNLLLSDFSPASPPRETSPWDADFRAIEGSMDQRSSLHHHPSAGPNSGHLHVQTKLPPEALTMNQNQARLVLGTRAGPQRPEENALIDAASTTYASSSQPGGAQYYASHAHPLVALKHQAIQEEDNERWGSPEGGSPEGVAPDAAFRVPPRGQVSFLSPREQGSPTASHSQSQTSSRQSLIVNDHFDQYNMIGNPITYGRAYQRSRNSSFAPQGSPPFHPEMTLDLFGGGGGGGLLRRTTLATARDWKALAARELVSRTIQEQESPGAGPSTLTHTGDNHVHHQHLPLAPASEGLTRRIITPTMGLEGDGDGAGGGDSAMLDARGSLPDITALPKDSVMSREEIARLSSQRREELRRMREEAELLRSNPLRYLFHPAVREWISQRKWLLLLMAINFSLALAFYKLLNFDKDGSGGGGDNAPGSADGDAAAGNGS